MRIRNKKLLGAPGHTTVLGARTLLGAPGIATRSKDATRSISGFVRIVFSPQMTNLSFDRLEALLAAFRSISV